MHDKPTDKFRRQHEELERLAKNIEQKLAEVEAGASAADVRRLLAQYAGKLTIHLRMEDEGLYPQLIEGGNALLQQKAAALKAVMGALDREFQAFVRAWPSAAAIDADPLEFSRQFARIVRAIGRRMAREEADLYALMDTLR